MVCPRLPRQLHPSKSAWHCAVTLGLPFKKSLDGKLNGCTCSDLKAGQKEFLILTLHTSSAGRRKYRRYKAKSLSLDGQWKGHENRVTLLQTGYKMAENGATSGKS